MFKFTIILCATIVCALAKPGVLSPFAYSAFGAPLAYSSPFFGAGSSRIDVRHNYNGFPASYVAAPSVYSSPLAYSAPAVASPYAAHHPFAAPFPASTYASAPFVGSYASPYAAPLRYAGVPASIYV